MPRYIIDLPDSVTNFEFVVNTELESETGKVLVSIYADVTDGRTDLEGVGDASTVQDALEIAVSDLESVIGI